MKKLFTALVLSAATLSAHAEPQPIMNVVLGYYMGCTMAASKLSPFFAKATDPIRPLVNKVDSSCDQEVQRVFKVELINASPDSLETYAALRAEYRVSTIPTILGNVFAPK